MSYVSYKVLVFLCDAPGCQTNSKAIAVPPGRNLVLARKELVDKQGWAFIFGRGLCPKHLPPRPEPCGCGQPELPPHDDRDHDAVVKMEREALL